MLNLQDDTITLTTLLPATPVDIHNLSMIHNSGKTHNLSNSQKKYFELAAQCASKSIMGKQTGSVIVCDGCVVSDGYNTYGGSYLKDPLGYPMAICSIHAEVMAVMKLWDRERSFKQAKVAKVAKGA